MKHSDVESDTRWEDIPTPTWCVRGARVRLVQDIVDLPTGRYCLPATGVIEDPRVRYITDNDQQFPCAFVQMARDGAHWFVQYEALEPVDNADDNVALP